MLHLSAAEIRRFAAGRRDLTMEGPLEPALCWLRRELCEMRQQDQRLLAQLNDLHGRIREHRLEAAFWASRRSIQESQPVSKNRDKSVEGSPMGRIFRDTADFLSPRILTGATSKPPITQRGRFHGTVPKCPQSAGNSESVYILNLHLICSWDLEAHLFVSQFKSRRGTE